jgi:prophage regulatory protein
MSSGSTFPRGAAVHDRLVRLPEVLGRTGLSRSSLYRMMAAGEFPRAAPLGRRGVGWPESEVSAWIASRMAARGAA